MNGRAFKLQKCIADLGPQPSLPVLGGNIGCYLGVIRIKIRSDEKLPLADMIYIHSSTKASDETIEAETHPQTSFCSRKTTNSAQVRSTPHYCT